MGIKSHIIRLLAAVSAIAPVLCSCRKEVSQKVDLLPVIDEILNDTSSAYHVDFSAYPENLRNLPIGVIGKDSSSVEILNVIMTADLFDNITGDAVRDSIRDFAGEHFIFKVDTDTTAYSELIADGRQEEIVERTVRTAARLMQDGVKILFFASDTASLYGYDAVVSLLRNGGSKVTAVAAGSVPEDGIANGYRFLRDNNLLAFRITPQTLVTNLDELPKRRQKDTLTTDIPTITDTLVTDNVPAQDSTGRD